MPGWHKPFRILQSALATLAVLALLGTAAASAEATNGTIKALKGGDRKAGETSNRTYALPVAGATFEYTAIAAKATDPASTGWTAFPAATDASGAATVSAAPGTYFVRERTAPASFSAFGPVKSLFYDPSSNVPASAQPYVAKVVVQAGQVTEAYPNRNPSGDTGSWSATSAGEAGSPFVNVRDDQAFPSSCGINVLMVLDRSGSIEPFKSSYRDAARAFVDALAGTPTQIGILSFSAGDGGVSSYQDGSGSASLTHSPLDLGDAGTAAALKGTIDAVYASPSGGTNWDRALQKASEAKGFATNAATGQTANPDVVVFITDGNPTARSTDGSDSGSGVDLIDLTAGMASANLVKNRPARALSKLKLYALGVGSGVTPGNLAAVSGPVAGEDYETPTVAQLTAKLTELAARTCGARVYVRKRLTGNAADQAGWSFSATSSGGAVSYLDGNSRTHATTGGMVETGAILTQLPADGREVTITEDATGQPLGEFKLDGVACRSGGYDGAPVTPVGTPALGVKLSVQRGSAIYCTFTNSPKLPHLTVSKTPDGGTVGAGQDAEFSIVVANTGTATARNVVLKDALPAHGVWSISADPGGCSIAAGVLTCGFGELAPGASRTVKVKSATSHEQCAVYDNPAATATADNAPPASDGGTIACRDFTPGIAVVKEGSRFAYPGDTVTFTFAVTNAGEGALHDVTVTDDRCAPVTGPVQRLDGDQDALLEPGEKWIFTCSKQIPAGHRIGDENPIRNVATASGKDELGKPVTDDDDHLVRVLHPAIDIEKTGPATARVGTPLAYTLTVTNPGDVPFAAQEVGVTDARCEQPPAGPGTGSDATPGQLDPGDTWTYTCTAQTTGQPAGTFVNTATVTARDFNGRAVTDTDDFPTELEAQQVLPQQVIVNGTARLRGPSGCVSSAFKATVRGSRIARVTFFRDGKLVKRIVAKPGQRTFIVRVKPGGAQGVHRVTAVVRFAAASQTRSRTLRLSYQRCRKQVVTPRFTG